MHGGGVRRGLMERRSLESIVKFLNSANFGDSDELGGVAAQLMTQLLADSNEAATLLRSVGALPRLATSIGSGEFVRADGMRCSGVDPPSMRALGNSST